MKLVDWVTTGNALEMNAFTDVRNVCEMVSPELVDIKKPYTPLRWTHQSLSFQYSEPFFI
ncbi:hypothetical protein D3C76_1851830 [compost metagenome]